MIIDYKHNDIRTIKTKCPYCDEDNSFNTDYIAQLTVYEQTCIHCKKIYTVELQNVKKVNIKNKIEIYKSENDDYISIVDFNEHTDRFILKIKSNGQEWACKFYNKDKNNFIGASFMAMYNLDRYFDRNIIKEEYYS